MMYARTKVPAMLLIAAMLLTTLALPLRAQSGLRGKLTIAGSSALQPMMEEAAAQFQKANPGVEITVTGGGSSAGRQQVCAGQIDIGASDVRPTGREKRRLNCDSAVETPVALQAFAPVANKTGPGSVVSLSRKQLQDIFTGRITNWKDVGGDDQPIVLIDRAKSSVMRTTMARYLFDGPDKFATGAVEERNDRAARQAVAETPGAISYLGFANLEDPSILPLQIDGVAPTRSNIMNGAWPVAGIRYAITKGQPNALANAFLRYVISADFQDSKAFGSLGFVPVNAPSQITAPKPGATVSGLVDVVATATSPSFNRWQIDILADQNDQKPIYVGIGSNETKAPEKLLTLDTTKLPNGIHTLRLRVVRNDSNYDEYRTTLNVQN